MAIPALIERGNSLSSSFMTGITLYRNQPGIMNKIHAEFGYWLTVEVAIIETVAAAFFTAISAVLAIFDRSYWDYSFEWLKSSAFSILWSFGNLFLNPFCRMLAANESAARQIVSSGDFFTMPIGTMV